MVVGTVVVDVVVTVELDVVVVDDEPVVLIPYGIVLVLLIEGVWVGVVGREEVLVREEEKDR